MKGSDLIIRYLEKENVDYIFGIPGSHLVPIYCSLYDSKKIKTILTKHESGASFMADGYAKISGKIGACCGTTGPGATNLITGVGTSYMDSTPVFVITAAVPTCYFGKAALQEGTGLGRSVSHVGLYKVITKYSECVKDAKKIIQHLTLAHKAMLEGRPGPVHLDLPVDVSNTRIKFTEKDIRGNIKRVKIDRGQIKEAARLLIKAKSPVILAGGGVIYSEASYIVRKISESFSMPVATTLKGKGVIDEDTLLALGTIGFFGSSVANAYIKEHADVMLALGCIFHEFTTQCYDKRLRPKKLIQVDIDPYELNKNYKADIAIRGDIKEFAQELLEELDRLSIKRDDKKNIRKIERLKEKHRFFNEEKMFSDAIPLKPQRVMKEVREALPKETIVFSESVGWTERYFKTYLPKTHILGTGLASLGYGTAACIGGKLAAPDKPVVCICGDGGFQFMAMEVKTATTYNVPVVWIILDNSRFGMIYNLQKKIYNNKIICTELNNPDFVKFAEVMGADGYKVTKPEGIKPTISKALKNNKPAIVDIIIDPDEAPPNKPRILERIKIIGAKLNYLDPKTIKAMKALMKEK